MNNLFLPAGVTNWTRHESALAPPLHTVPAGKEAVIWSVPTVVGSYNTGWVNNNFARQSKDRSYGVSVLCYSHISVEVCSCTGRVNFRGDSTGSIGATRYDENQCNLTVADRKKQPYALKSVELVMKVPVASATTGVLVSMVDATSTVPQGLAVEGRCTSARTAVPVTPRAGVIML